MGILSKSLKRSKRSFHNVAGVVASSSCAYPGEILCCRGPCEGMPTYIRAGAPAPDPRKRETWGKYVVAGNFRSETDTLLR